jgi:hypothetical protein
LDFTQDSAAHHIIFDKGLILQDASGASDSPPRCPAQSRTAAERALSLPFVPVRQLMVARTCHGLISGSKGRLGSRGKLVVLWKWAAAFQTQG